MSRTGVRFSSPPFKGAHWFRLGTSVITEVCLIKAKHTRK